MDWTGKAVIKPNTLLFRELACFAKLTLTCFSIVFHPFIVEYNQSQIVRIYCLLIRFVFKQSFTSVCIQPPHSSVQQTFTNLHVLWQWKSKVSCLGHAHLFSVVNFNPFPYIRIPFMQYTLCHGSLSDSQNVTHSLGVSLSQAQTKSFS